MTHASIRPGFVHEQSRRPSTAESKTPKAELPASVPAQGPIREIPSAQRPDGGACVPPVLRFAPRARSQFRRAHQLTARRSLRLGRRELKNGEQKAQE